MRAHFIGGGEEKGSLGHEIRWAALILLGWLADMLRRGYQSSSMASRRWHGQAEGVSRK